MKDFYELEKAFDKGLNEWQSQILKKGLLKIGQHAVSHVKELTPVRTGLLRRSFRVSVVDDPREMQVRISNNLQYAAAVNYGKRLTKNKKTIGKTKGAYMLEKGIKNYTAGSLRKDIDEMLSMLKEIL